MDSRWSRPSADTTGNSGRCISPRRGARPHGTNEVAAAISKVFEPWIPVRKDLAPAFAPHPGELPHRRLANPKPIVDNIPAILLPLNQMKGSDAETGISLRIAAVSQFV